MANSEKTNNGLQNTTEKTRDVSNKIHSSQIITGDN